MYRRRKDTMIGKLIDAVFEAIIGDPKRDELVTLFRTEYPLEYKHAVEVQGIRPNYRYVKDYFETQGIL